MWPAHLSQPNSNGCPNLGAPQTVGFLSNMEFFLGVWFDLQNLLLTMCMWQVGLETPVTDLWCVSMAALLVAVVLCRVAAAQDWAAIYESHWAGPGRLVSGPCCGNGLLNDDDLIMNFHEILG